MQAASQRAGAYFSSWGTWASEKRRTGWGKSSNPSASTPPSPTSAMKEKPIQLATNSQPKSVASPQVPANGQVLSQGKPVSEKETVKLKVPDPPKADEREPEPPLPVKNAEANASQKVEAKKEEPDNSVGTADKVSSEAVAGAPKVEQ